MNRLTLLTRILVATLAIVVAAAFPLALSVARDDAWKAASLVGGVVGGVVIFGALLAPGLVLTVALVRRAASYVVTVALQLVSLAIGIGMARSSEDGQAGMNLLLVPVIGTLAAVVLWGFEQIWDAARRPPV